VWRISGPTCPWARESIVWSSIDTIIRAAHQESHMGRFWGPRDRNLAPVAICFEPQLLRGCTGSIKLPSSELSLFLAPKSPSRSTMLLVKQR